MKTILSLKAFPWLIYGSMLLICSTVQIAAWGAESYLHTLLSTTTLPDLTQLIMEYRWWCFALTLPWLIGAVRLSRRDLLPVESCLTYLGTAALVMAVILFFSISAYGLAYVSIFTLLCG